MSDSDVLSALDEADTLLAGALSCLCRKGVLERTVLYAVIDAIIAVRRAHSICEEVGG